jgi:hypothetical protein
VNRSINMTLLRINGSFSFMNIIPKEKTNMSLVNRSLELIDFRFNNGTRTIPEPDSFGYCSPIPMGISGAQPDYGTGGYCVPPPSVSDLYEETKEALRDLAKAYSESSKDISKYYNESSDDMGYLSYVLKKKGYNRYVYGEHKEAVFTGGSMYPCEEQCYKCCSKWDEECKHKAWNKYISTPNVFESVPVACGACVLLTGVSVLDWGHLAEMIASHTLKGLFVGLGTIGGNIYACGDCAYKAGEYIKDLSECCIGEWYDCNCRCVSIRW